MNQNFNSADLENELRDGIRARNIDSSATQKDILGLALWARDRIHGKAVPQPTLRKRMAGSSLTLCVDLYQSMASLAVIGGSSAISVLVRSVVESYALGFWLAHVASDHAITQYSVGRETKTLKPLLNAIYKSPHAGKSRLVATVEDVSVFDSLTHGGIRQMMLRNINGQILGSARNRGVDLPLVTLGAQMCVLSVETFIREIFEDECASLEALQEGQILIGKILS